MTLQVLVERLDHGQFRAVTSQPIALSVEADSPRAAVHRLKEAMEKKLAGCEVVEIDLSSSPAGNPWLEYAGVWKENPEFEAFRDSIMEYRRGFDHSGK